MRVFVGAVALSICVPLCAKSITYPVPVPIECVPLAEREHVPTLIESRYQAIKAEYKLYRLKKSDPLVAQCREAVDRLKAQAQGK